MNTVIDDLRYPVGHFDRHAVLGPADFPGLIEQIAAAPAQLRAAVEGLDDGRLDTPYREGGWTVRQVVHHVPDSHMNAYVRFKLALTESNPAIKTYDESAWAELADTRTAPIAISLQLLDALHDRWVRVLRDLSADDFRRTLHHPEMGDVDLRLMLGLYAWHGRHHVAHVTTLRRRMGW
jgi:uncharacterized damage-inducible protein DinB